MGNSSSNEENRTSNKKQSENPQSKLPLSELQSLDIDTLNKEFARNEKNDIDQKNRQLVRRWEANNKLRISFWEAYIAKVTLGENWHVRYTNLILGKCPLSFPDEETWIEFTSQLTEVLRAENITGWFALRGSGATFMSMHPNKGNDPDIQKLLESSQNQTTLSEYLKSLHFFDCKVHNLGGAEKVRRTMKEYQVLETFSDLDFNIKSPELVERLKKKGARPSSDSVGGNYNQDDTFDILPGLWTIKADWTARLQRDISFVSVNNPKDINSYSNHPFTFVI